MKKIFALLLVAAMLVSSCVMFAGCGAPENNVEVDDEQNAANNEEVNNEENNGTDYSDVKLGFILIGDENEGYTYAHMKGVIDAAKNLGLSESQLIWKYRIGEDETCYDAAADLADQGCIAVFSNSYGHQTYMKEAAAEFTDVKFVSMTGDQARAAGLDNYSNAFTSVYQSRYVSGVVAGMKVAQLLEEGKLSDANFDADGNVKIGYVGAYPYAEVVSGYTAFFLGIRSIVPNVAMQVTYTNSWFDIIAESEAANALMSNGCVIIGQHADSTGAPASVQAALEKGNVAYSIGYNIDMLSVAPQGALTSATNNWAVYYEYAIGQALKGESIVTNWSEGYATGAVDITTLGESCAPGTAEKVEEVVAAIVSGELNVFDTKTFTVGGAEVTSAFATDTDGDFVNDADEAVFDGYYHESYFQSAPSFSLRIDGITELN